ncbi:hypothetical protein C8Q74DRAFT_1365574 [Fomes fomentarius]|nr:hypothetical protein C8Q74DRAFT_1365574 [Fomes fomentarius]
MSDVTATTPALSPDEQAAAAVAAMLAALPPLDRMGLISIWVETLLYGINVVVFFGALYVLLFKQKRGTTMHIYLFTASMLLFVISTAHVAVALRQLITALTDKAVTSIPGGSVLYFLDQTDTHVFANQILYVLNVLVQDLVLIWRLFAVMGGLWWTPIIPLILEGFHTSTAIYSVVALFNGASIQDPIVRRWGLAAWALDLTLNILVTGAIAGKIWWQGRQTVSARGHNAYLGVAYTILESGGLFTGATLILFILYINASTGLDALVGVNVVVQLATLSPLLIIARVGFGLTHGNLSTHGMSSAHQTQLSTARFGTVTDTNTLRVDIHRSQVSDYEAMRKDSFAMHAVKSDL